MTSTFEFHFGKYSYTYDHNTKLHRAILHDDVLPQKNQPPAYLQMMVTNYCNLQCSYCYADSSPDGTSVWDKATLLKVLVSAAESGLTAVTFGGGEPLSQPWLLELLKDLRKKTKLELSITTNGTLITQDIAEYLKLYNIYVRVSINTVKEYYHRKKGLAILIESGMQVGINSMLTRQNHNLFEEIIPNLLLNDNVNLLLLESQSLGRGGLEPLNKDKILLRIARLKHQLSDKFNSVILSSKMSYLFEDIGSDIWLYPPELVNSHGFMGSLSWDGTLRHTSFCPVSCGINIASSISEPHDFLQKWEQVKQQPCLRLR